MIRPEDVIEKTNNGSHIHYTFPAGESMVLRQYRINNILNSLGDAIKKEETSTLIADINSEGDYEIRFSYR
jgi:hypothetical protein